MSRRTYIYDADLDAMVEITAGSNHPGEQPGAGMHIIRDIEPYRTVAADKGVGRINIGGRRQHREFLTRNGYTEVGNDPQGLPAPRVESWVEAKRSQQDRVNDIKRAAGLL